LASKPPSFIYFSHKCSLFYRHNSFFHEQTNKYNFHQLYSIVIDFTDFIDKIDLSLWFLWFISIDYRLL